MSYRIKFLWDDEAAVWIAISQDVPGLVLESGSFDALVERVRIAVPELVDLNGAKTDSLKLSYYTEREADRERAAYYNQASSAKWGEPGNYDLCVNTDHLTMDAAAQFIVNAVKQ